MATAHDAAMDAAVERWNEELRVGLQARLAVLAQRSDAEGRVLFALLYPLAQDPAAGDEDATSPVAEALGDAARLAPDDLLVARLEFAHCPRAATACSRTDALARWQRLEPDNAVAWLAGIGDATAAGGDEAAAALLARAARAEYHDLAYFADAPLVYAELRRMPMPPRSKALARELGERFGAGAPLGDDDLRAAWASLPSLARQVAMIGPHTLCRAPGAAVAADCRAVHRLLAAGDTLIERSIGLSTMARLSAGTPDAAYWQEQLRQFNWLRAASVGPHHPFPATLQRRWAIGEVPALQEWLAAQGRATPPPGWQAPGRR
ncbi:hypothetical protein [Cognatilysobacter tabacisoli]|uniref:hypothetical protein n=1 Tax=Cognatilysobacter tabacisoli TaxID=2315424 RepID=UPI001300AAC3|nr:hypothetical protein [Lysobacter tabacisoli]